jgi:hypothetical protein
VTDAHKAFGQDVEEEAADEFVGIKDDGLFSIAVFTISVAQGDPALLHVEDAVVGARRGLCSSRGNRGLSLENRKAFSRRTDSWR